MALHWGDTLQTPGWDPRYDLDDNQQVDAADITVIAERWGEACLLAPEVTDKKGLFFRERSFLPIRAT